MSDGGRAALGGYLWQALGLLGFGARALIPSPPDESSELDAIVDLVAQGGAITNEPFEQDAMLETMGLKAGDERILLQFKYSRQPKPPSISQEDLKEIEDALVKSGQRAGAAGRPITAYVLITNRHIASEEEAARKAGAHPGHVFERELDGVPFRVFTRVQDQLWASWLDRAACRYGCTDTEIRDGIYKLLGQLFVDTQGGHYVPIHKEDVLEALTGIRDPRPLEAAAVNAWDEQAFDRMLQGMGLVSAGGPPHGASFETVTARRDALEDLARLAQTRAIIAVIGLGGTGKTVAVGQWIREFRARGHTVAVLRPGNVVNSDHYLGREARDWATDSAATARGMDTLPDIIERLARANGDTVRPLFVLGLDGLDAGRLRSFAPHFQRVLGAFADEESRASRSGAPPCATLVVTCRERDDIKDYLPMRDLAGYGIPFEEQCGVVNLVEFTWEELLQAARLLPESLYMRLADAVAAVQLAEAGNPAPSMPPEMVALESGSAAMLFELESRLATTAHIDPPQRGDAAPAPVSLLRHPVLWRAFLQLEVQEQEDLLIGDTGVLPRLARQYVGRFCSKAAERIPTLRREYVFDALASPATSTRSGGLHVFTRAAFLDSVHQSGVVTPPDNTYLYDEALSAGVITREGHSRWRWTHEFIHAYLADHDSEDLPPMH